MTYISNCRKRSFRYTLLLILFSSVSWAAGDIKAAYTLGAGDTISISVFNQPNLSLKVQIDKTQTIQYPFIGAVDTTGKTANSLANAIRLELQNGYLVDPQVFVTMVDYRPFYILGDVNRPGGYSYTPGMTVNEALALAGGLQKKAFIASISVIHESQTDMKIAVTDSYSVQPGDTLEILQSLQQFFMSGDVKRPGVFPYQSGMTIQQAISQSGGLVNDDLAASFFVIHADNSDTKNIAFGDYVIQQGDSIEITQANGRFYILGEVMRPGGYAFEPGMTMMEAIALAGGLQAKTSYSQSQALKRMFKYDKDDRGNPTPILIDDNIAVGDTIVIGKGMNP